jgi:hypothetical protein
MMERNILGEREEERKKGIEREGDYLNTVCAYLTSK